MLFEQTLREIRKELAQTELRNLGNEEYIAMLSSHTESLVQLLEQMNSSDKHAEKLEHFLELLFRYLSEPICMVGHDLTTVYFNAGWEKLFGGKPEKGLVVTDLLPEQDRTTLENSIKLAEKKGKRMIRSIRIDEHLKVVGILPFSGFQQELHFLLLVFADDVMEEISDAKSNLPENPDPQKEIGEPQEKEQEFLGLIEGFWFEVDYEMNFQYVSESVKDELGYEPRELVSASLYDLLPENYKSMVGDMLVKLGANTTKKYSIELEVKTKHQTQIFYEMTLSSSRNGKGLAGLCKNINGYKIREENLINEKNNAELNDKRKSDFLANMSHEVRTPLNGIVGFSTMMGQENLSNEKREKYLRIMRSSAKQLLTIINDIIDHSKIEAGQLRITRHKVNIHHMLDDLLATYKAEGKRMQKEKLRIIKQTPDSGRELFLLTDEIRLKQVLSNLIGNAMKFTQEGSIVFGYSLETPDVIRFFVRDSGVGLCPSFQKSIFKRFGQTPEGVKHEYQGTGLGLAISKGIVELLGGEIGVSSQNGEGAEFYFTLPYYEIS